jgi:hypothetical protein
MRRTLLKSFGTGQVMFSRHYDSVAAQQQDSAGGSENHEEISRGCIPPLILSVSH